MSKAVFEGYITLSGDFGCGTLIYLTQENEIEDEDPLIEQLYDFAKKCKNGRATLSKVYKNLNIMINKCNVRMYYSDSKCTLEEAEGRFIEHMYYGNLHSVSSSTYYSEFTLLSMDVKKMQLGPHDITEILKSHLNKYVHFVIEAE